MDALRLGLPASRKHHWFIRVLVLALVLIACAAIPFRAASEVAVGIGVSVGYPPPPLPLYLQPPIPGPGYIWIPGYWTWGDDGYYWVSGYWAWPPYFGALWTPGYWGWFGGVYFFHGGYWARHVGFYGGICYGFGYPGRGYAGGRWEHDGFHYNRSVNQINNVRVTNVYNGPVPNNGVVNRTSFNGGRGGVMAAPTSQEAAVAREAHVAPMAAQMERTAAASHDPAMRAAVNHGAPLVAGTARAMPTGTTGVRSATVQAPRGNMVLRSANFAPRMSAAHAPMAPVAGGFSPAAGRAMNAQRAYPSYGARTYPSYGAHTYPSYNYRPMNNPGAYRMAATRPAPVGHAARPAPAHVGGNGHH